MLRGPKTSNDTDDACILAIRSARWKRGGYWSPVVSESVCLWMHATQFEPVARFSDRSLLYESAIWRTALIRDFRCGYLVPSRNIAETKKITLISSTRGTRVQTLASNKGHGSGRKVLTWHVNDAKIRKMMDNDWAPVQTSLPRTFQVPPHGEWVSTWFF